MRYLNNSHMFQSTEADLTDCSVASKVKINYFHQKQKQAAFEHTSARPATAFPVLTNLNKIDGQELL